MGELEEEEGGGGANLIPSTDQVPPTQVQPCTGISRQRPRISRVDAPLPTVGVGWTPALEIPNSGLEFLGRTLHRPGAPSALEILARAN